MHQRLLVIQNGRKRALHSESLQHGKDGNAQTLAIAAELVREDSALDQELRRYAEKIVSECPPRDDECEIQKLFERAQLVKHVDDPPGVERIADAWTTINEGFGDCGDKAIMLASLLGTRGHITRFAVAEYHGDDLNTNGYDHVYIELQLPDGSWRPLDPDAEKKSAGWEMQATAKATYEIFGEQQKEALGDWRSDLLSFGVQYGAAWMQQNRQNAEATRQLGAEFDALAGSVTRFFDQIQSKPVITSADAAAATSALQQLAAIAQQYSSVEYIAQQWSSPAYRPAYEARLRQIQQAAAAGVAPATSSGPSPLAAVFSGENLFSNPLVWLGVGLIAAKVVFK